MTEKEAFDKFHDELKLDPEEVGFAQGFPKEVREALTDGGVRTTNSFLQGSLARGTMVSPLKDVDMVVSLDRDHYGGLLNSPAGPDQAMDLIKKALESLRGKYPGLRLPPRKRHALPIELGGGHPSFDLVPAFETTTDDDDVLIADRDHRRWKLSNPRELKRVVAEANQKAGGNLIHVIRMVKHAVRTRLHKDFPGLAIESIAIEVVDGPMSYPEACRRVFANGAGRLGGPILDPTGRDNLAPKIDQIETGFTRRAREWFQEKANEARLAREASNSGDHDQAIAWWHGVFGSPFPEATGQSLKTAAVGLAYDDTAPRTTRAWRRWA